MRERSGAILRILVFVLTASTTACASAGFHRSDDEVAGKRGEAGVTESEGKRQISTFVTRPITKLQNVRLRVRVGADGARIKKDRLGKAAWLKRLVAKHDFTVVSVSSSTCSPCMEYTELDNVGRFKQRLEGEEVGFVAISIEEKWRLDSLGAHPNKGGLPAELWILDDDMKLVKKKPDYFAIGGGSLPYFLLVARDMTVVAVHKQTLVSNSLDLIMGVVEAHRGGGSQG